MKSAKFMYFHMLNLMPLTDKGSPVKNITNMSLVLLAFCTLSLASNLAYAHSTSRPINGGIVETVGDTTFELVVNEDSIELYIMEEGVEIPVANMTAKIMINLNGARSEVMLEPGDGNGFSADGVTIPSGAKVSVMLTHKDPYSKIGAKFIIE